MSNEFAWNDAIATMNKNNSLKSLLGKLMTMWAKDGRVNACLLYSCCNTVGFSDFKSITELEHYIDIVIVDMIYIKTKYGEYQIYLDNYDTYRFEDRKDYKLLKILLFGNKEIIIKL